MRTIKSQVGTVILSLRTWRLYGEPTHICNCSAEALGGESAAGSNAPGLRLTGVGC
jgi:hypothetical protein